MSQYNPINEFLLFLIRSIDYLRHKAMASALRRRLATVRSEFIFIRENGNGGFDICNLSLGNLQDIHAMCKYQNETEHSVPFIDFLKEKTGSLIWKEK